MAPRFGSVLTAMVTPFDDDLALDLDAAVALARWLTEHGSDGLVLTGTTGEAPTLTDAEKADLWRAVAEAVTVPVLAGTGTYDTAHTVALTRSAVDAGVDGILVVTPYYNRPSQAGLAAHFGAAAEAAGGSPVLVYDIPFRAGRKIATDTLVELARRSPNVVGVKDAAGDMAESARLVAATPDGFEVYSGEDKVTLPLLAVGAVGTIGVATHWAGELVGEMVASFVKGDVEAATAANARLLDSWAFESTDDAPNPLPSKAAMRVLGHRVGDARPPMGPSPAGLEDRARAVVAAVRP